MLELEDTSEISKPGISQTLALKHLYLNRRINILLPTPHSPGTLLCRVTWFLQRKRFLGVLCFIWNILAIFLIIYLDLNRMFFIVHQLSYKTKPKQNKKNSFLLNLQNVILFMYMVLISCFHSWSNQLINSYKTLPPHKTSRIFAWNYSLLKKPLLIPGLVHKTFENYLRLINLPKGKYFPPFLIFLSFFWVNNVMKSYRFQINGKIKISQK